MQTCKSLVGKIYQNVIFFDFNYLFARFTLQSPTEIVISLYFLFVRHAVLVRRRRPVFRIFPYLCAVIVHS